MGLLWQVPRENWRGAGGVSEVHGGRSSLRVPWVRLPCRVFPSLADNTNRCFLAEKPLGLFGLKNPPLKNFSSYDIWMCRPLPRESRYCWQPVLWQGGELVLKSPRYHPLTNHRYHHRYQGELVLQSPENYHLLRTLELDDMIGLDHAASFYFSLLKNSYSFITITQTQLWPIILDEVVFVTVIGFGLFGRFIFLLLWCRKNFPKSTAHFARCLKYFPESTPHLKVHEMTRKKQQSSFYAFFNIEDERTTNNQKWWQKVPTS